MKVQYKPTNKSWFVACGEGMIDKMKPGDAVLFKSGAVLAFRLAGKASDDISNCTAGIKWPCGWSLHFHIDPTNANWPKHPELHYQFTCPNTVVAPPPFAAWRPPANVDAIRWIEWAVDSLI